MDTFDFSIRVVSSETSLLDSGTIVTYDYGSERECRSDAGLRPVIMLKDGVGFTGGTGTIDDPYTF